MRIKINDLSIEWKSEKKAVSTKETRPEMSNEYAAYIGFMEQKLHEVS